MKIFFKTLLYFIPIPIIIVVVNYFIDPANIFHPDYEKGIADYLVTGKNVTNVVNYNERMLQKYFIEKISSCPGTIVLGSSRIMQINSVIVKDENLINSGVSGASLQDLVSIYSLYEKKGCKIKKVILGLDPWILNENNTQERWKTLADDYYPFVKNKLNFVDEFHVKKPLFNIGKYRELVSSSYFKTSLEYVFKGINKNYIPTNRIINDGFTRLTDGSIYYDKIYREASDGEIKTRAKNAIAQNPVYSLGDFINFSHEYKVIFIKFIEYLQHNGIEVEFFLSPYHPIVYDYFKKNTYYHIVFQTETFFRKFASTHQINILGSYDPEKYSFDNSYFYDGFHCNEKAINLIFENSH